MSQDSGAKSHFIDFAEIMPNLLLIIVTFHSVPRAGEEYSSCQNLSAVGGEREASCASVTVQIEVICVGVSPCEKQSQKAYPSLPKGKSFPDLKAGDPKRIKEPDRYR